MASTIPVGPKAGILFAQCPPMTKNTNNPAPHAGEKDIEIRKSAQTPGMAKPPGETEPEDPKNPRSKPQGTTDDQVKNFEAEGQAQEQVDPEGQDATATTPPGHWKDKRDTL